MATSLKGSIKISADENNTAEHLRRVNRVVATKSFKTSANVIEPTKRPALGELGNRNRTTNISLKGKDVQLKEKNVIKPRVDTHWKKTAILDLPTTSAAVNNKLPTLKPINRITTKVIPTKSVIVPKNKTKDDNTLRREDSNLSRLSITKLRAAFTKDHRKDVSKIINIEKPTTKITSNNDQKIVKAEPTATNIQCVRIKESEIKSHSVQMLNLIENIDEHDCDKIVMVPEYVNDIYSYLYNLEISFPIKSDYMKNHVDITPKMRAVLLDWINEISYQYHLLTETYQMIVSIIDRYLQAVPRVARSHLQLVGVAAIFIAVKYEELCPLEIDQLVYITDNAYNKSKILAMERKIMRALDFQLSRPIPLLFLRRYSKAANAEPEQYICSKYIIELISIQYECAHYKPSEVAAAALYLSMQLFNKNNIPIEKLWTPTLKFYTRYDIDDVKPIVIKMANTIYEAPQDKQKSVYKKYALNKFDKISTKSELYGPVIQKIISSELEKF